MACRRSDWRRYRRRRTHARCYRRASNLPSRPVIRRVHHASVAHHGRDRMLEDQLLLAVVFQQHRILVKRPDLSSQLDTADQINGDGGLVLADSVQECVLNVLCRLVVHVPISCFLILKLCSFDLESVRQESPRNANSEPESKNTGLTLQLNHPFLPVTDYLVAQPVTHRVILFASTFGYRNIPIPL